MSSIKMSEYSNTNFPNCKYRTRETLYCAVCSAPAFGMNFNASPYSINVFFRLIISIFILVTCQSCKAFFRRNALKPPVCYRVYS
jgi:hypothetical protein